MPKFGTLFKRGDARNTFATMVSSLSEVSIRRAKKAFDKEEIELDPNDPDFVYLITGVYNTCKINFIAADYIDHVDMKEIDEEHKCYT